MANLYPVFETPDAKEKTEQDAVYKTSVYFGWEKGDFPVDSSGKLRETDEMEAWTQWCRKAACTQRGAYLCYSNGFGADLEGALSEPTREAKEAALQRTIKQALMADPYARTAAVENFSFLWEADSVHASFDVRGRQLPTATLRVSIPEAG